MAVIDIESGSQPSNIAALYAPNVSSDTDINAESPVQTIIDASRSDYLACSFDYVHVHANCSDRLAGHMMTSQESYCRTDSTSSRLPRVVQTQTQQSYGINCPPDKRVQGY